MHALLLGIVVICLVATFLLGVSFGRQEKRNEEEVLDLRERFDGYRGRVERPERVCVPTFIRVNGIPQEAWSGSRYVPTKPT